MIINRKIYADMHCQQNLDYETAKEHHSRGHRIYLDFDEVTFDEDCPRCYVCGALMNLGKLVNADQMIDVMSKATKLLGPGDSDE